MGFIASLLGANNSFKTSPTATADYLPALQQSMGNPQATGQQQNALAQALLQQMQGQGPNLGQTQLQAATDRGNAQAAGLIGSQVGLSPALAARQILNQQAANQQAAANQSAQLQQQQQLNATGQLGNVLNQQRQGDISQLGTIGGLQNQQNQGIIQQQGIDAGVAQQNAQQAGDIFGGVLNAAGSALTGGLLGGSKPQPQGRLFSEGGTVPGEAQVSGDSPKNDTVPALLSPGEIVIPRSLTNDADFDPEKIAEFVTAVKMHKSEGGYGKVVAAKRKAEGK